MVVRRRQSAAAAGANAIRRDLGEDVILKTGRALKRSIQYALDHREEALDYALSFARGLRREDADQFVGMYVNDMTLHTGAEIRRAARLLLYMDSAPAFCPQRLTRNSLQSKTRRLAVPAPARRPVFGSPRQQTLRNVSYSRIDRSP